jgi:HK97 gp10 family phage protein
MAKPITFRFEGLPGFKDALERATNEVRAKVSTLMEDTAADVRDSAQANVRAYTHGDGDLEDAIVMEGKRLNWRVGVTDVVVSSRGGDRVHQRPFIYGHILEHGTHDQPAEPFMRPAADEHLPKFQGRLPTIGIVI